MALKYKIDSLEGLNEEQESLYKQSGDKYILDIDGVDNGDVAALKEQNEKLLTEKKEATKKAKDAEEAARKSAEEKAKKDGDVEALEKSWQEKWEKRESEYEASTKVLGDSIASLTSGSDASTLAAELAVEGSASALLPHISNRLGTDVRDGKHVTVVLDKEGKPSATTLEEFKKEISETPAFAPLIAGSRASGGGAGQGQGGGGVKDADYFNKASPHFSRTKQTEIYKQDPARYEQLSGSAGQ